MEDYFIGTAPFCSPSPYACGKLPGYVPGESSDCGDGSCCMTGKKIRCKFDYDLWKKTALYKDLNRVTGSPDILPQYEWFGEAPLCGADDCDVYKAGFLPLRRDRSGYGASCVIGDKIAGVKAVTKSQEDRALKQASMCSMESRAKQKTWQKGLELGTEVAKVVGKAI